MPPKTTPPPKKSKRTNNRPWKSGVQQAKREAAELLAAATPLPWYQRTNKHPQLDGRPWGWIQNNTGISSYPGHTGITWSGDGEKNAKLIVHAVNRLPDYEAAVDALENLIDANEGLDLHGGEEAREVLLRLRGDD